MQMNIAEAKAKLSELVAAVERGEDVILARGGHPVARITSMAVPAGLRFGPLTASRFPLRREIDAKGATLLTPLR